MHPQKVNIFISYVPTAKDDAIAVSKLFEWMYPMRDEVNLWVAEPPPRFAPLSLPWQLLLFWYVPLYQNTYVVTQHRRAMQARREQAHIYLFMTSYKSLIDKQIDAEITLAVNRLNDDEYRNTRQRSGSDPDQWRKIYVFPVIVSPCRWKEESRLARFKPLNGKKSLAELKPEENGYLDMTDELIPLIKKIQANLSEEAYARMRPERLGEAFKVSPGNQQLGSGLADTPAAEPTSFKPPPTFYPPEWLGWTIIFVLFFSVLQTMNRQRLAPAERRYQTARPADDNGPEPYRATPPALPPPDAVLPLPEDSTGPVKPVRKR